MFILKDLPLALAVMTTGCELISLCEVPGHEHKCVVGDESTESGGDGDGDPGDGDPGDGDPGDGDGEPGDGDGDGDGDPPDPIVYPDNPLEDYTRVDRSGTPAFAMLLISSKDVYNAANPTDDSNLMFFPEYNASIMTLHDLLDDDLMDAGLVPCFPADFLSQALTVLVPETLKIDLEQPAGFPNGRRLTDPVIDIVIALLLLDLDAMGQDIDTLADIPLNPPTNDVEFDANFPYLAPPN